MMTFSLSHSLVVPSAVGCCLIRFVSLFYRTENNFFSSLRSLYDFCKPKLDTRVMIELTSDLYEYFRLVECFTLALSAIRILFFLFRFNTYNTIFIFSMKCKKWNWLLSVSFADLLSGNNAKKGSFKRFHETTTGLHNKLHHNKRSDSFFGVALGLTKPLIKFNLQRVSRSLCRLFDFYWVPPIINIFSFCHIPPD